MSNEAKREPIRSNPEVAAARSLALKRISFRHAPNAPGKSFILPTTVTGEQYDLVLDTASRIVSMRDRTTGAVSILPFGDNVRNAEVDVEAMSSAIDRDATARRRA